MKKENVSPMRWIIILAIVPIIVSTEMMWLSLAPIASLAEKFYGVSSFSIALFSMSYMIMYIIFSLPASWVVDKFGYRKALIIGALITAVFGVVRFIFVDNYTVVLASQFILAMGQPFLLNISTKVPANWFPQSERSTAAGILIMAQYIGFALPMLLAPSVAKVSGIQGVFKVFAIVSVISAIIAILFTRENPKIAPPGPKAPKEDLSFASMKNLFKRGEYTKVLFICFVSIGVFNTLLTLIEFILIPRGISTAQAGGIGAIFVVAGIIGAAILPIISDKIKVRIPMIVGALGALIPFYLGFTFISNFYLLGIVAALTGFTVMGVAPILFQHGSEVAYPIQEGTSLGVILMMGQISGIIFVAGFEVLTGATNGIVIPMIIIIIVTALQVPIALKMKESDISMEQKEDMGC